MLRLKIEKKMDGMEVYLNDLTMLKAKLELARGAKVTKEKIVSFVKALVKGDPKDKEYQKRLIDTLVYKVYVSDDDIVVYLNVKGGKDMERISLSDTRQARENAKNGVQSLTSMVHQMVAS